MNDFVKRVIGESKDQPLPVLVKERAEKYYVCPHCQQEILEKHTFIEGDFMGEHVERHSDCKGAIQWPPPDPETVAYMKKHWNINV